jgi:cytochrome P450
MLDAFARDLTLTDKSQQFLTFDVIGDLAFGEPFDCLRDSTYHPWVSLINNSIRFITYAQALAYYPRLRSITSRLIPPSFKRAVQSHLAMTREKALRRKATKVNRNDLISNLIKPENGITDQELCGNSIVLITAGSETTATTLCSITWFLLQNDDVMQKLKEEVRTRFQSEEEINFTNVAQLKYMLACLNEAMRLFPPAPTGHPRIVPKGGDMIASKWVPEGVILAIEFFSSCLPI